MRITMMISLGLLAVVAAGMIYVRLAPSDPARWHVAATDGVTGPGGFALGVKDAPVFTQSPQALLARVDDIALREPRTTRLAGSVKEGRITYISRSRVFGFPDYITVEAIAEGEGARLLVFSRLRFGKSDLGVNSARMTRWIADLQG
ncbi:MAG: hypothetical protein ACI9IV_001589 [Paracoccaceae bacterium]|jgi:hypothetical protein